MGANTAIEWTWQRVDIHRIDSEVYRLALEIGAVQIDATTILVPGYTFNPWIGCTKVDELCAHCYAAEQDKFRHWTPEGWGPGKPRKRTREANWKKVRTWNELAGRLGIRQRVFCASLADWLDDDGVPIELLADLLGLIHECQNLDWLLLTKRPENWRPRVTAVLRSLDPIDGTIGAPYSLGMMLLSWLSDGQRVKCAAPANVWVGTSVGHQKSADVRIPQLLKIPACVRFLSCEPMLGPVDLTMFTAGVGIRPDNSTYRIPGIDWVICGGESGPGARPMHPAWARSLRDQCAAARVPFLWKQWGEWLPDSQRRYRTSGDITWGLIHQGGKFRPCLNKGKRLPGSDVTWLDGEEGTTRVGKSNAGRLLDGVEHNGSPEVNHAAR